MRWRCFAILAPHSRNSPQKLIFSLLTINVVLVSNVKAQLTRHSSLVTQDTYLLRYSSCLHLNVDLVYLLMRCVYLNIKMLNKLKYYLIVIL